MEYNEVNEDSLREKGEFYKKKGNDEYYKKNFNNAIYFYTEGIKVKCNDKDLQAKLYSNRAIAHFYLGNYEQSLSDAAAATDLQPTFLKAIERGANACVKMNRLEEAITWCDKGLAIDNNNQKLLEVKMECLEEQNKRRPTEKSQTETVKGTCTVSSLNQAAEEECTLCMYRNLGDSYFRVGDFTKATGYYNQCVKISREVGDKAGEGTAYGKLGSSFLRLGDFKRAKDYCDLQLEIAKEVGDKSKEGRAYGNLGNAFRNLGDFKKAADCYQRLLTIAQEVGDTSGERSAYCNLGNTFHCLGDYKKAIHFYNLYLKFASKTEDSSTAEVWAYNKLGNAFYKLGDFKKAIDSYNLSLKLAREVGGKSGEGTAYNNLGAAFYSLHDFQKAIDNYTLRLKIVKEVGHKSVEGSVYNNLGNAFLCLGDFEKARINYSLGLKVAQTVSDGYMEGCAYGGLGLVSSRLGDFKKAIDYHNLHLTIAKEVGDKVGEGKANGNLGNDFGCLGDFQKALEYQQRHLEIAKEVDDKEGEGSAYLNLGNAFYNVRDFQNAIENFNLCHKIAIELGDKRGEGKAYGSLGSAFFRLGDVNKAKDYFDLHLKIAQEVGDRSVEGKAYYNLGLVFHGLREFDKAIVYQTHYLNIAKEMKDNFGEAQGCYGLGQVFESLNVLLIAFDYYKMSVRSFNNVRNLLEFKDEWKINFRNETNEFREAYTGLWRVLLKQGQIAEALFAAEEGRAQALNDLMKSQYAVQASLSMLGERDEKEFKSLSNIPSSIVFQALLKGSVNFWVLGTTGETIQFRRKELDDPIASTDVTDFFQSLIKNACEEIGVRSDVRCEDRSLDTLRDDTPTTDETDSDKESSQPSLQERSLCTLYDVMIEPIANLVQGSELIVVPDGPLWLVPYAALVDHNSKYLCESFKVRLVPSLTTLQLIADRPEEHQGISDALLVGDPWYEEVVEKRGKKRKPLLKQLPFARKEVEMIGEILQVTPLIGKEATKNKVLKRLSSAALVHIAAHGSMETGEIALTPDPNRTFQIPKREDYTLTMADVLSVRLRARLVVLSCCHSAKGKIKAEGVVGIARAFIGAGARSVLMSLWAINDEATMEFMAIFLSSTCEREKCKRVSESGNEKFKGIRQVQSC